MYISKVEIHSRLYPTCCCYPFNIPALRQTAELTFRRPVAFFVGENGSGKSTLLEAIARRCGIHLWDKPKRHLSHQNPYEAKLVDYVTVMMTETKTTADSGTVRGNGRVVGSLFRAETFRDLADFLDDVALCDPGRLEYHGGQILNTLSHGQAILSYLSHRYRTQGLFLLDEPEAALSPLSQLRFLELLHRLESNGGVQFVIATHSPILLSYPGAQIFDFDTIPITEVAYEETSHYRIYKQFFTQY